MIISQLIITLQNMRRQYGNLPVYISGEIYGEEETECAGIRYYSESDDDLLDEQLPERFFIKG
jgi:hypothetical protein